MSPAAQPQTAVRALLAVFCVLLGVPWAPAAAHDFVTTDVVVLFKTDGSYQIDLRVDVDALALGAAPRADSAELARALESMSAVEFEIAVERARDTLTRRLRPRFDGVKQLPLVSFPVADGALPQDPDLPSVLGTTARLAGRIPADALEFTFGASRAFNAVHVTILDQGSATGRHHILEAGSDTPPFPLGGGVARPQRGDVVLEYAVLGFKHILPRGLDHMLFVLGLFLFSTKLKPLLWQISAFTLAHTVTLALAMYDVVTLPSRLVESLIALSIAYVAIENLLTTTLRPRRALLVFGFGLLHGLGFAGVLVDLGLPQGEFASGLIAFNVGVELGQLAVVALAFLCIGWFRNRDWYRPYIVLPLSALIALIGVYWALERGIGW